MRGIGITHVQRRIINVVSLSSIRSQTRRSCDLVITWRNGSTVVAGLPLLASCDKPNAPGSGIVRMPGAGEL